MNRLSRAEFVQGALALATAASTCGASSRRPPAARDWEVLALSLQGGVVRPGDDRFFKLAQTQNLRYAGSDYPAGIALCRSARDVSTSLRWAREHALPLVARNGGHSYAGYSRTAGLMIDLSPMSAVTFDPDNGTLVTGGGARNRHVFAAGEKHGVAITHGRCFEVGIPGLTLGGGVGFNMRLHQLTCDHLFATQIVTADGAIHERSASNDPDGLFWACRGGGGGNFGINTTMTFSAFPVSRMTVFRFVWNIEKPESLLETLMASLERAPITLGSKVAIAAPQSIGAPISIELLGQMAASPQDVLHVLAPVLGVARPEIQRIFTMPYWAAERWLSEPGGAMYYNERSRFFNQPFDHRAVATVLDRLRNCPATTAQHGTEAQFKVFQTGGSINEVAAHETAFVHRSSTWLSSIEVHWQATTPRNSARALLDWQSAFYASIVPLARGGAYQNFIDPDLHDWRTAYYGENLPRLRSIKSVVDPDRIFTFPEAI
jgi:FAD/FMN-containing dehydrogenase